MSELTCRNCGHTLPATARGCTQCAWNLEAEKRIDRVILWMVALAVVILILGVVAFFRAH